MFCKVQVYIQGQYLYNKYSLHTMQNYTKYLRFTTKINETFSRVFGMPNVSMVNTFLGICDTKLNIDFIILAV